MVNTGSYIAMSCTAHKGADVRPRGVGHNWAMTQRVWGVIWSGKWLGLAVNCEQLKLKGRDVLERETGFEPATSTLARLRSTN